MFTGIVEETGLVSPSPKNTLIVVADKVLKNIQLGGSMAVNGVCLTVTSFDAKSFTVDVMPETLRRTNLGQLRPGDSVNLERPLSLGGELGGHLVQGHIDNTGKVLSLTPEAEALLVKFEAPPEIMHYIVEKGFIAIDGASLTVANLETKAFQVSIVGFTRRNTTLGKKKPGDIVNLEVDIMAKYAERFSQPRRSGITNEFLQEHGFAIR
jgi:riboflavin synthase